MSLSDYDVMLNISDLQQTYFKSKENVTNKKFNALLMNMEFISVIHTVKNIKNPVSLVK
jgi:hypothetical protein